MNRVVIGNQFKPSQFTENLPFSENAPYYIFVKKFINDDITVPHYSDTIEILFCDSGIKGFYIVDECKYLIEDKCVIYCPPSCLHQSFFEKGDGTLYVLKISYNFLKNYLNLENVLNKSGNYTIFCKHFMSFDFDAAIPFVKKLIECDTEIDCIQNILELFSVLKTNMLKSEESSIKHGTDGNDYLPRLIDYSEKNFLGGLSNSKAAKFIGYNEEYFCRWFVKKTGMTYKNYLMNLKINYACKMLASHVSVNEVIEKLGYSNASFFIRKFKEYMGCTPGTYIKRIEGGMEEKKEDSQ